MDIILLKDVQRLGKEGSTVRVKAGYARNFLVPQGLAIRATDQNRRIAEERTRQAAAKTARVRKQSDALKQQLEKSAVTLKLTVGEGDTPFGSVTAHDLVEALEQKGLTIEKQAIQLDEPIKTLGAHEVPVRLHAGVTATLKVKVVKA